ncbi:MAG TPA: hypothetical protein VF278_08410 [Pirellulales bacterium]
MEIAVYKCDREFVAALPALIRDGGFDLRLTHVKRDCDGISYFAGIIRDGRARICVAAGTGRATGDTVDNSQFDLYVGQCIVNLFRFPRRHLALGARVETFLLTVAGDRVEVLLGSLQENYAERYGGEPPP